MQSFLARHRDQIQGVLSGFDRVLFRGTLRSISYVEGLDKWLGYHHILYRDFGPFAQWLSDRLKAHAQQVARKAGRPYVYLAGTRESKEAIAARVAERDGITRGLVCVLAAVEPCQTFALRKERATKTVRLISTERKCLHLYYYYQDREFGLMHVRVQSWLPMSIQVCVNGREYLARRMERAGIGYEQQDNGFTWIEDVPRAQRLLAALERRDWERYLRPWGHRVNPWLAAREGLDLKDYYWTARQTEYATDIMFTSPAALAAIYPALQQHAMQAFQAPDVLRFLGRRIKPRRFGGEVRSELATRTEGTRVKHWVEENSIKMYDKQGSVLRIETTINNPRRFKGRRRTTRVGHHPQAWLRLRKSVADLARRAEVSCAANERYLDALGVVGVSTPTRHLLDPVSRPIVRQGQRYRALRPIADDSRMLALLLSGQFHVQGFRNRDLRPHLFPDSEASPPCVVGPPAE